MGLFKKSKDETAASTAESANTSENMSESTDESQTEIRHNINANETFTLAKDVYDLRTFIKGVYNNRAVISRRFSIFTLCVSALYTLAYIAYILISGLVFKLSVATNIFVWVLIGVWAAVCVTLIVIMARGGKGNTKSVKRASLALKIFRLLSRLAAIVISIMALVFSLSGGEYAAPKAFLDIIIITLSIIMLIIQLIPMLFGGVFRLIRWLISPVKKKCRFSFVLLEWYNLTVTEEKKTKDEKDKKIKRVDKRYYGSVSSAVDTILIPALGKKYITSIKSSDILSVINSASGDEKPVIEGIFKSVFGYAEACGYVTFNPCRDLNLQGDIEEKQKKTIKDRFVGFIKDKGKSAFDKFLSGDKN